jgi:polysaccharide biosynthesis protein PslJ
MTTTRIDAPAGNRSPAGAIVIVGTLAMLAVAIPAGLPAFELAALTALISGAVIAGKSLVQWHSMIALLLLVILYVPIKKYSIPGNLPFDLEPYRLIVMLISGAWLISLLVDSRVRLRSGGLEAPFGLLLAAMLAGVITNGDRIRELKVDQEVIKGLTFFLSYLLVYFLIVSVVRSFADLDRLVRILVAGATGVAIFAFYEARTGYNVFNHLSSFMPFLQLDAAPETMKRGSRLRISGSGQGAIPFGAAMMLLVPMAIYVATRARRWYWWVAAALICMAGMGTNSRTTVIMILAFVAVFAWLRPRFVLRLWPALIPLVIVIHVFLPGTIGTLRSSFFPEEGLVAQQSENAGQRGSGRIADLGPALDEWSERPILGQGYSTRITGRVNTNAHILDNQWLKTLLEIGIVGFFAWLWIFTRTVRRLGKRAKGDNTDPGWMAVAIAASVTAFAVGMLFYDAFAFIQVTFLMFILLAFGSVLVTLNRGEVLELRRPRSRAGYPA